MRRDEVRCSVRRAGEVLRYHTWPMLQRETVAHHTWNVLVIWDRIFGMPGPETVRCIVYHDVGELITGDMPFPVKRDNPVLKQEADRIEADAVRRMGVTLCELTPQDKWRLRVCDMVDVLESAVHELKMGCTYAEPSINWAWRAIESLCMQPAAGVPMIETSHAMDYIHKYQEHVEDTE